MPSTPVAPFSSLIDDVHAHQRKVLFSRQHARLFYPFFQDNMSVFFVPYLSRSKKSRLKGSNTPISSQRRAGGKFSMLLLLLVVRLTAYDRRAWTAYLLSGTGRSELTPPCLDYGSNVPHADGLALGSNFPDQDVGAYAQNWALYRRPLRRIYNPSLPCACCVKSSKAVASI